MRIVSVGEILWDVIGDREYLGGAPLNFAAHARQLGHEVFLLSAVGDDDRGRRALEGLRERGISTEFVQVLRGKDTGIAEVELDTDGKPMFRIVRPAAYDFVELTRHSSSASRNCSHSGFTSARSTTCRARRWLRRSSCLRLRLLPGAFMTSTCATATGAWRWWSNCRRRRTW